jgi:hypothetical protein
VNGENQRNGLRDLPQGTKDFVELFGVIDIGRPV